MRARLVVLHYTGMASAEKAIHWLAHPESKVSCHYVIDEAGTITQMVAEASRAWHAGASHWAGETDVNSVSIGIEIQNPGHDRRLSRISRSADAGDRRALPRHHGAARHRS